MKQLSHEVLRFCDKHKFTKRETAVFEQITQGVTTDVVAGRFGISVSTVRNHLKSIFRRTSVHSVPELFALFIEHLFTPGV